MADPNYKLPQDPRWIEVQKRTFTRWMNNYLVERMMKVDDLATDLSDGLLLVNLLEVISAKSLPAYNKKPKIRAQKLENTGNCLQFLKNEGLKLVAIGPEDITDCNLKLILGLIWTIILRYHIAKNETGSSAKNDLLEWVRTKIPECNVNDFTRSWADGRAVNHLVEALMPGTLLAGGLEALKTRSPLENAVQGEDLAEKVLGIPQILLPEDMVAAADELSCMTYISFFRDFDAENRRNKAAELARRTVEPKNTRAFGPGLEGAETGIPAEFTIQAVNVAGVDITTGGEVWDVKVDGASLNVQPKVTDNSNGSYSVVYVATMVGPHKISVNHSGKPIANSPWTVPVVRAPADPMHTIAYGPGLESGVQGQLACFTIEARDRLGQRIKTGGDAFKVMIDGPHNRLIVAEVKDNQDGTHTASYTPIDYGKHTVQIALKSAPVAKSPYTVQVAKPAGYPEANLSYAEGPGLKGGNTAEPARFTIYARDGNNNAVILEENPFIVDIINPDGTETVPKIVNNHDGSWSVEYRPKKAGMYDITVGIKNPAAAVYYEHVKDSPFRVPIVPGCDAAKTRVYGPGIEDGVQDNLPTHFTIEARDTDGKPMGKGGDPFEVNIAGPNRNVPAEILDNGDGTYTVNFAPDEAGPHKIDVKLKGNNVANAPYSINVREGADHNTSFIEQFQFMIRSKNKRGANMSRGGEKFTCEITGAGGGPKLDDVQLNDNGDGSYTVRYKIPTGAKAHYSIAVKVNGKHIVGSPWDHAHN